MLAGPAQVGLAAFFVRRTQRARAQRHVGSGERQADDRRRTRALDPAQLDALRACLQPGQIGTNLAGEQARSGLIAAGVAVVVPDDLRLVDDADGVATDLARPGAERIAGALRDGAVAAELGLPRAEGRRRLPVAGGGGGRIRARCDRRHGGLEGCGVDEPGGQRLPQPIDRWLVVLAHFSSFRAGWVGASKHSGTGLPST
ncbi:MAG: hypothetical protein V5B34_00160 [Accumulibacter sp.]